MRSHALAVIVGLALAPGLALAAGPLEPAIARGAKRVSASYLDTGMSGMSNLVDQCLREAKRQPNREKYAECVSVASAAIGLDRAGAARFRMPPLLDEKALIGKTGVAFRKHGGSEDDLRFIYRRAAESL